MEKNRLSATVNRPEGENTTARSYRSVKDLLGFLGLDSRSAPYAVCEKPQFSFLVPESFVLRMRKADWFDPLLLQVLPRKEEEIERDGFTGDAVNDADAQVAQGVLRKYASRVLLLCSCRCAVHCRFCFRRKYQYSSLPACRPSGRHAGETAWQYLDNNKDISEVILSGGDPFCCDPADLEYYSQRIIAVPHIKTVRIHTRLPLVDPGRITPAIIGILTSINNVKACIVVIHANHANELSGECSYLLTRLRATGALLLNQSVLLRGVNDSADALCELSRRLIDHGVLPYYLHQLDRVRGAWHFEVDEENGKKLLREARNRLPGYAVPRYVREVAGENSKKLLL